MAAAQPVVRMFDDVVMVHAGLHPHWDEAKLRSPLRRTRSTTPSTCATATPTAAAPPTTGRRRGRRSGPGTTSTEAQDGSCSGTGRAAGSSVTARAIGLDTGCCYGGKLSAWIAEEDRIVQVDGQARAALP
jgi:hypothetical protein